MDELPRKLYEVSVLDGVLGTIILALVAAVVLLYRQLLKSYSADREKQRESNRLVTDSLKTLSDNVVIMTRAGDDRTRAQERTGEAVADMNSAVTNSHTAMMMRFDSIDKELDRIGHAPRKGA